VGSLTHPLRPLQFAPLVTTHDPSPAVGASTRNVGQKRRRATLPTVLSLTTAPSAFPSFQFPAERLDAGQRKNPQVGPKWALMHIQPLQPYIL